MQTTIRGGEKAIRAAHALLKEQRRGDRSVPEISVCQIGEQLGLGVDRVMCEGALYDRQLAALAIKQAQGDLVEAIFLVRAFRTTLRRFGSSEPIKTESMHARRRVATTLKEPPGGQFLGATYDYTHRLIDFSLAAGAEFQTDNFDADDTAPSPTVQHDLPDPLAELHQAGLIEPCPTSDDDDHAADLTRDPASYPARRDVRLQALARGDEGFLLSLAYSSQRGFGRNHPFISDLRIGDVTVEFVIPELGFAVAISEVTLTECKTINDYTAAGDEAPRFTQGYGLAIGQSERKAIAIALIERALRANELGEEVRYPAQDEEFVLQHADTVASSGLVQHLKLPHYVDFQSQFQLLCKLREEHRRRTAANASDPATA
ncbi:carbon-phosphorus lyase complex subunit PhnI [Microbacteriaceae bacterium K1510]|nr:carbon-phosphorus lyase complex subunit PhnI [Microbacteriaceae bacterium K1510]